MIGVDAGYLAPFHADFKYAPQACHAWGATYLDSHENNGATALTVVGIATPWAPGWTCVLTCVAPQSGLAKRIGSTTALLCGVTLVADAIAIIVGAAWVKAVLRALVITRVAPEANLARACVAPPITIINLCLAAGSGAKVGCGVVALVADAITIIVGAAWAKAVLWTLVLASVAPIAVDAEAIARPPVPLWDAM